MPSKKTNVNNADYAESSTDDQGIPSPAGTSSAPNSSPTTASPKRKPTTSPSTPVKKAKKATTSPTTAQGAGDGDAAGTDWSTVPGWTSEKREAIMIRILTPGSAWTMSSIATEFNIDKKAFVNAMSAGRKGNSRDKLVKFFREM